MNARTPAIEAIGLSQALVDEYFTGTTSRSMRQPLRSGVFLPG